MNQGYIQQVLDYVEEHICETMTAKAIAEYVGFSKYYFHRIFYVYTGMQLMEYVRRRKMEHAMVDIANNQPVLQVALKYGYGSDRAFARAFKAQYGMAPSHYRNRDVDLPRKLQIGVIGGIRMLEYLSGVDTLDLDQLHVLSMVVVSSNPEEEVIALMSDKIKEHGIEFIAEYGMDVPVSEKLRKAGKRGYEFWLVLTKEDHEAFSDPDVEKKVIPASRYARLQITDPFVAAFERIPNGWKKLISVVEEEFTYSKVRGVHCLEKVTTVDGVTYMDVLAPID